MPGTTTTAASASIPAAIQLLVDHVEEVDDHHDGWRYIALANVLRRWSALERNDPFWYALSELAAPHGGMMDTGFDAELREATIRFLSACDDAAPEVNENRDQGQLTVRKFRAIETAYEAMGKELDRIRRDA